MNEYQDLSDFNRYQLYSVINQLKEENNCLKTELIKYKLLSKSYDKYLKAFDEINETIASNQKALDLRRDIKVFKSLTQKKCLVYINKLSDNCLKKLNAQRVQRNCGKSQENNKKDNSEEASKTEIIKIEIKDEDIKKEIKIEDNQSPIKDTNIGEPIGCHLNVDSTHNSKLNDINIDVNDSPIDCLEETPKQPIEKNKSQCEDNTAQVLDGSQLRRNGNKRLKTDSIICGLDDCDIEIIETPEINIDLVQISDISNEESKECETIPKSGTISTTPDDSQIFGCKDCSAVFTCLNLWKAHVLTHKYLCITEGCGYRAHNFSHLMEHEDRDHSTLFQCCQRLFKYSRGLRDHIWATHPNNGKDVYSYQDLSQQKTQICDNQYKRKLRQKYNNIQNSIESNGNGNELNVTFVNIESVKNVNQLSTQTLDETQSQVFPCDWKDCQRVFNTIKRMRFHRIKHTDQFICDVYECGYRGGKRSHLERHYKNCHLSDILLRCPLIGCGKRFKTQIDWTEHKKGHQLVSNSLKDMTSKLLKESQFDRTVCLSHDLSSGTFECLSEHCSKLFPTQKKLRNHLRKVHKMNVILQ